jgi:elongation factor 1-beta
MDSYYSYQPSQSDSGAFDKIKSAPSAKDFPYVARWFTHIKSFGDLRKKFPGAAAANNNPAAPAADDDDVDLFGSDEEVLNK